MASESSTQSIRGAGPPAAARQPQAPPQTRGDPRPKRLTTTPPCRGGPGLGPLLSLRRPRVYLGGWKGRERLRDGTGRAGSPVTGRSHHRTEPLAPFGASLPPVPAEGGAVKSVFGSDGPIIIGLQTKPAAARESRESPARNVRRRYKTTAVRPRWDSNPQSPAPEADALSIRPLGHPAKAASAVL